MHPDQLLNKVVWEGHIGTPERRHHLEGVAAPGHLEPERFEDATDFRGLDDNAEHLLDAGGGEGDAGTGQGRGEDIDEPRRGTAARDLLQQVEGARLGVGSQLGPDAFLEPQRCLAAQLQLRRGPAD